jgi:hypothetical protein
LSFKIAIRAAVDSIVDAGAEERMLVRNVEVTPLSRTHTKPRPEEMLTKSLPAAPKERSVREEAGGEQLAGLERFDGHIVH